MTRKRITLFEYCSNKGLDKLMSEWNYERNKNIDPKKITYGSSKMAWWKCEHGHEWQASIYDRTHFEKSTCPYCSNRRVLKGYNDLKSKFPRIARQWDYSKNEGVSPQDVFYNSSKEAWWKCKEGHSWKATVKSRTYANNNECPYCANKKTLKGYNDLETTNPELLKEWYYDKNDIQPCQITVDSFKKVWWKCKHGHKWKSTIASKIKNNGKCPICSNKKVLKGYNDLATVSPEIAKEWNYDKNKKFTPSTILAEGTTRVWWKCEKGHEWETSPKKRTENHSKCPYCSGLKVWAGYNDLATTNPELLDEWDYKKNKDLKPIEVSAKSTKKVWWKCKKGHEWLDTARDRTQKKTDCPYCSNLIILKGYNDLKSKYPELVKEWDYDKNNYLNPEELIYDSNLSVWWKCENGHSWRQKISDRTLKNKTKCPKCLRNAPSEKDINLPLNITHPELAKEWNTHKNKGVDISSVTASSVEKVWWKCKKGHEWESLIYTRTHNDKGCPFCKVEKEEKE